MSLVEQALAEVRSRSTRGSPYYYWPLPLQLSQAVNAYYKEEAVQRSWVVVGELNRDIQNGEGTLIARGYTRVVIGDYGAYLEFNFMQAVRKNLEPRFKGDHDSKVKYIWMQTKDQTKTKVYHQKRRVQYADYKPGMFYVSPFDVT